MRMKRTRQSLELISSRHGRRYLWLTARRRLYSRGVSIGVRRDMSVPFMEIPPAKIPLVVRRLRPDDDLSFIAADSGLSPQVGLERADQRWLLGSDLPAPWVAVDPDGKVCYMQLLLTAQDNAAIRARWRGLLPQLQPDEALAEGPYVSPQHRRLGITQEAGKQILERARDSGVRYTIGFMGEWNDAILGVAEKAAFVPYLKREESWFLFRRRIRFVPLANATK